MRFHSLVFAHTIGAPLVAIDYTNGGKVAHYARERGLAGRLLAIEDLMTMEAARLEGAGLEGLGAAFPSATVDVAEAFERPAVPIGEARLQFGREVTP
jgi:hypothetical protein